MPAVVLLLRLIGVLLKFWVLDRVEPLTLTAAHVKPM